MFACMLPLPYTTSRCVHIEARDMLHLVTAVGLTEVLGKCKLQERNFFGNVQGRAKLYETESENVRRKEGYKCMV